MKEKYLLRFNNNISKEPISGCWLWTGSSTKFGHGMFSYNGKTLGAHRFSALIHGLDIDNKLVCHHCDNPACVNPEHLFVGTQFDNMKDMLDKNRQKKATPKAPKPPKIIKTNKRSAKQISTPNGIFNSRLDAARYYNVSPPAIGERMQRHPKDYFYINNIVRRYDDI